MLILKNQLTMSSRDIAYLVESRHSDVCKSIKRLIEQSIIQGYTATPYTHPQNSQTYYEYHINKRDTYVIVAQLSPAFTARLVDRWQELEDQNQFKVPQTLPEALRLAAELADQVQQQQLMIEHQKPAVEFVERFVEARSAKSMREVAKVLGIKEKDFITKLLQEKILFRQSGSLLPFAGYQHKGYFTVKTGEAGGHAYQQTRFTPQGINWISKRFGLIAGGDQL